MGLSFIQITLLSTLSETMFKLALRYLTKSSCNRDGYYISGKNQRALQIDFWPDGREHFEHLNDRAILPYYVLDNGVFLDDEHEQRHLITKKPKPLSPDHGGGPQRVGIFY